MSTSPTAGDDTGGPPAGPASDRPGIARSRAGWLVVAAFALGALAGWLVVSAVGEAPDAGAPSASAPAAPSSPPPEPLGQDAEAQVSDACLRALAAAEETVAVLEEIGGALAALDVRRLDEVIHDLRPVRDRLRAGTAACEVEVPPSAPADGTEAPATPSAGP